MSDNNTSSGGIGILGMMFIVLFVGKVFEIGAVASWSWWWITAPLWGGFAVFLAIMFAVLSFALIAGLFTSKKNGLR